MHTCGAHVLWPAGADHDLRALTSLRSHMYYEGFRIPYNLSRVVPYRVVTAGGSLEHMVSTSCTMIDCRSTLDQAKVCHRPREKLAWEAWWGGARGGGGLAEPGSCHGWSVRGRHQLQPLPPQRALEVIQTIYAERTDFPCQTYPPGTGWAELAANGLNPDYLEAVQDEDKYKAKYSAYTARLCQQHVETCHVAVSARANGAAPARGTRPLRDPHRGS